MIEKFCTTCSQVRNIEYFTKSSRNKSGYYYRCKLCQKEYVKNNIERIKIYRQSVSEKKKIYMKEWNIKKRDHVLQYRERTYELKKDMERNYYINNKKACSKRGNEYHKKRIKIDPVYALKSRIRGQVRYGLKMIGVVKKQKANKYLGISYEQLKIYLENKFKKGMTWENAGIGIGKWNIDHIIPLASAKTEEELIILFHYRNLQPMWSIENIKKGKKIPKVQTSLPI